MGEWGSGHGVAYGDFFRVLTGHEPLPYQMRLAEVLQAGQSVVLRAPTGAGKTWAAVAPFLYGLAKGVPIADRLFYALPLRTLATSLHSKTHSSMQKCPEWFTSVVAKGKDRAYEGSAQVCSLQIGGESNDPFFESDLIFTTIDQLLSGYLLVPVSLPDRLANINAGALIGSQIILDEAHLLDPATALGTAIEMLDRTRGYCQFVIMTATLSTDGLEWLARKLGAQTITIPDEEVRNLPSQRTKERTWRWAGGTLTAQAVAEAHEGGRTIVLVNTVTRAQRLYKDLSTRYAGQPTQVLLLHSRFYPTHRKQTEQEIEAYFGPESTLSNVVLVTTQVIEAGLDISGDCIHTEVAPMNSLVQRAGRVARYQHRSKGVVIVYECERLGPYREQKEIVAATTEPLSNLGPTGRIVDFREEQGWVDHVHREKEMAQLSAYQSLKPLRDRVHEAMQGERGRLSDLVRNSQSVNVLVTAHPEAVNFSGREASGRRVGWPVLLGVPAMSLITLAKTFGEVTQGSWVAKGASDSESDGAGFVWTPIQSVQELRRQWLVAIHPEYASYGEKTGLILGEGGNEQPVQYSEVVPFPRYQYEFEPWTEHIRRVLTQARAMSPYYRKAAQALAGSLRAESEAVSELVDLTCALHDLGKLRADWQAPAWTWQREKDRRLRAAGQSVPGRPDVAVAHTTFDPKTDREIQRQLGIHLPNHAVEGAYAAEGLVSDLTAQKLGEAHGSVAALAVVSAIARHHSPRAKQADSFKLASGANDLAAEVLGKNERYAPLAECANNTEATEFGRCLFYPAFHEQTWPLYVFLTRRLRLADQGSLKTKQT